MKRIALAFGLALAASVAQAGVIQSVEDAGTYTTQVAGATTVNWNDYSCGAYTSCTGDGALVTGSVSGRYASPYGITDRYLTVPYDYSAGAVSLTTPGSYNYFGLYWGSLDVYNSIHFFNGGSLSEATTAPRSTRYWRTAGNRPGRPIATSISCSPKAISSTASFWSAPTGRSSPITMPSATSPPPCRNRAPWRCLASG